MFTLYGILQQCNFLTKSIIRQHLRKVTVLIRFNKVNIMISDADAVAWHWNFRYRRVVDLSSWGYKTDNKESNGSTFNPV